MATKHNVKQDEEQPFDWSKAKMIGRGVHAKRGVRMPLGSIRLAAGLTQVEVAEKAGVAQSEVSRIEARDDVLASTLRRYIEALGGKLEIVAAFPQGHRIIVDLDAASEAQRAGRG